MSYLWGALFGYEAVAIGRRRRSDAEKFAAQELAQHIAQYEANKQAMLPFLAPGKASPRPSTQEACAGCGSRETIIHRGARKCAYCRSDR